MVVDKHETESVCRHCHGPIVMRGGRWWHRAGWFSLCGNAITKAEPTAGLSTATRKRGKMT